MKKILSINILNYNNYINLRNTLESLISIKYFKIEILIFDDNSKDKSLKIAKEFKKIDCRIKIYKVKKNVGVGNLRNLALKLCKGHYLMFVDSGDEIYSKNIDSSIEILNQTNQIMVVLNLKEKLSKKKI